VSNLSYLWQAQPVDDVKEELEEEEAEGKSWGEGERQGLFQSGLGSFSTVAMRQSQWL